MRRTAGSIAALVVVVAVIVWLLWPPAVPSQPGPSPAGGPPQERRAAPEAPRTPAAPTQTPAVPAPREEESADSEVKSASQDVPPPGASNAAIQGIVTVGKRLPARGSVSIHTHSGDHTVELSAAGTYRIDGLPAGAWTFDVGVKAGDGEPRNASQIVTLTGGETTQFDYDFALTGSLRGTVTGLREGEAGGAFAFKGEYAFSNVSEDDLYDFGNMAQEEAHVGKDGTFSMTGLEAGTYTVLVFSMRNLGTPAAQFYYAQDTVEIVGNTQAAISLSLD